MGAGGARRAVVAEFAVGVVSPALDAAGVGQRAGVVVTDGDLLHRRQPRYRHRHGTVIGGAVAELAGGVVAPALHRAAVSDRADGLAEGADRNRVHPGAQRDGRGGQAIGERSITDLALDVGTPAGDAATIGDCAAPGAVGSDGGRATGEADDVNRHIAVGGGVVTQGAGVVVAPALDRAGVGDRAGVVGADTDRLDPGREADDVHRRGAGVGRHAIDVQAHRCAVAQLTQLVGTPALDAAGVGEGAGVARAAGDLPHPAGQAGDGHRNRAVGGGAVTELTHGVATPAFRPTAAGDGAARPGAAAEDGDALNHGRDHDRQGPGRGLAVGVGHGDLHRHSWRGSRRGAGQDTVGGQAQPGRDHIAGPGVAGRAIGGGQGGRVGGPHHAARQFGRGDVDGRGDGDRGRRLGGPAADIGDGEGHLAGAGLGGRAGEFTGTAEAQARRQAGGRPGVRRQAAGGRQGRRGVAGADDAGVQAGAAGGQGGQVEADHRRRGRVRGRLNAQLSVGVGSPALDGAVGEHGARAVATRRDRAGRARQAGNRRGCVAFGPGAITELVAAVEAPAGDGAAGGQSARVVAAGTNIDHSAAQARHRGGGEDVGGAAVSHLTVVVVAPAPNRRVHHRAGGLQARRHGGHAAGEPADADRPGRGSGGAVAERAAAVATPALQRAAGGDRAGVERAD